MLTKAHTQLTSPVLLTSNMLNWLLLGENCLNSDRAQPKHDMFGVVASQSTTCLDYKVIFALFCFDYLLLCVLLIFVGHGRTKCTMQP